MRQLIDLNGKKILITGASSGIGRACAILCSQLGAQVALVGRSEEKLAETKFQLHGKGHIPISSDLSVFDNIENLVSQVVENIGPLDGVIHSAGISKSRPLKMLKPEHLEEVYAINVIAGFEIMRAVAKKGKFSQTGCSVVMIASVMSVIAEKAKLAYCSSKAALVHGAKVAALELAPLGFRVNCISPGMVRTEMLERLANRIEEDAWKVIVDAHPLGVGVPNDISSAACFLLSNSTRWITGTNLIVDGGFSCK